MPPSEGNDWCSVCPKRTNAPIQTVPVYIGIAWETSQGPLKLLPCCSLVALDPFRGGQQKAAPGGGRLGVRRVTLVLQTRFQQLRGRKSGAGDVAGTVRYTGLGVGL